ncbi:MAG: conjugative transposon protein TraJ [Segetibacter sp.]
MTTWIRAAIIAAVGIVLPQFSHAQYLANEMKGLHGVLDQLYNEMMPLCSKLIGVGQGIAGFAATWYIASRVWRHIANAEPIDFYPLFRPFVIGFAVMIFPSVLAMINGVMKPTVTATSNMVKGSDQALALLLKQKEQAIKDSDPWKMYVGESGSGDRDRWYKYTHPGQEISDESTLASIGNDIKFAMSKASYNFRNSIKEWMSEVLRVLFEAAALCINTLRTFQLIVLAILGPLVFGISVFDGFQHTLTAWIARYINIFLWLPVANIFGSIIGKIQEKMIFLDINQIQSSGDTFFSSTDAAYLVFMIMGIVGYSSVPSVANYIVHAGGGSAIVQKVNSMFYGTSNTAVSTVSSVTEMGANAFGNGVEHVRNSMSSNASNSGYFPESGSSGKSNYMKDKLTGNS